MKVNFLALAAVVALSGIAPKAYSQADAHPAPPSEAIDAAKTPSPATDETVVKAPSSEASDAAAKDWRLMLSPVTLHFHPDPDHRYVYMIGLERQYESGGVFGATYFHNSFGQPSAFVFGGYRFRHLAGYDPLFAEVVGGIMYGYVAPFNHKVPFDVKGFAPGAVASLGWQLTPTFSTQLNLLGLSAVMLQFSADF